MTTPTPAEQIPLSQRLREVSFSGHGSSDTWEGEEKSGPRYYDAYLKGGLTREGIAAQAAQHFLMYEALESAAEAQRAQQGEDFAFWMPELHRLPALVQDLEHWIGQDWEPQVRGRYRTPGIRAYVDRIEEVGSSSLPLFVAHHYTRYLADLSGGLMIARMFERAYGIEGDEGVRFYRFPQIADPTVFKERYRSLLDEAGFGAVEHEQIAQEVARAYALNNAAGADLEARFEEYRAA